MKRNTLLIVIEIIIIGGILFGWIAPLLFPSEEPEQSISIVKTLTLAHFQGHKVKPFHTLAPLSGKMYHCFPCFPCFPLHPFVLLISHPQVDKRELVYDRN